MSCQRHAAPSPPAAAEAAARHCASVLRDALSQPREAFIAISGGTTPALMFDVLAREDLDWQRIHVFWVDERNVAPGDPLSNFTMAEKHLLIPARIPPANIHRMEGEREAAEAARRYEDELRRFFAATPRFDVLQLGIGPDAHTASLFPGEPLVADRDGLVAAVYVEKLKQWRITLLPGVLLAASNTIVLATGPDKATAVKDVFTAPFDPKLRPAQLPVHLGHKVECFLDEASAKDLS